MKTHQYTTTYLWLLVMLTANSNNAFSGTEQIPGTWKGTFMQQFEVVIQFVSPDQKEISGSIQMFDGSQVIQDDKLTEITIEENLISFLIPDKETIFNGRISQEENEIQGEFIFPDGTKHPLQLYLDVHWEEVRNKHDINGDNVISKKYTSIQLKEDLLFLEANLSDAHPQYDYYTPKEGFDTMIKSTMKHLNNDLTIGEYYAFIAPIVAKVGCNHTGIRVPENYQREQRKYAQYLPLKILCVDERAWVVTSYHKQELIRPGSEIISINEVPIENILRRLLSFIPSEGNIMTSKYYELNKHFNEYFNFINNSESFQVEYIESREQDKTSTEIPAIPFDQISHAFPVAEKALPVQPSFEPHNNCAILKIKSFAIQDLNMYLHFMDSIFVQIKEQSIDNLVLDLRGNSGGHPIFAAILYSYLSHKEFTYFKRNDAAPEFEPLYNPMPANKNNFGGNCYVLINGGCLSTTGHLISLLKYYKRAVFIGEEPGSWFYCNDFSKQVKLPNTLIEMNIPQATFETAVSGFEKADRFEVDYPVQITVFDLINQKDVYMDFVFNLLNNS